MAKDQSNKKPVALNFKKIDKEAAQRAQAALAGGRQDPLTVPKSAKVDTDKNGVEYSRWTEQAVIMKAERGVSKSGLMEVLVSAKIRQSPTKENTGKRVWGRFYINLSDNLSEGHQAMNDRSNGALLSLAGATNFLPKNGELEGSALDKLFPAKGQPGAESPLNNKTVVMNVVQTLGPQKNQKTGKPVLDDDGEPILERRDGIESFLPVTAVATTLAADEDEDEDEDEDDEDETDESDDEDEDEEEDDDEVEEEEDETPAPPPAKRRKK